MSQAPLSLFRHTFFLEVAVGRWMIFRSFINSGVFRFRGRMQDTTTRAHDQVSQKILEILRRSRWIAFAGALACTPIASADTPASTNGTTGNWAGWSGTGSPGYPNPNISGVPLACPSSLVLAVDCNVTCDASLGTCSGSTLKVADFAQDWGKLLSKLLKTSVPSTGLKVCLKGDAFYLKSPIYLQSNVSLVGISGAQDAKPVIAFDSSVDCPEKGKDAACVATGSTPGKWGQFPLISIDPKVIQAAISDNQDWNSGHHLNNVRVSNLSLQAQFAKPRVDVMQDNFSGRNAAIEFLTQYDFVRNQAGDDTPVSTLGSDTTSIDGLTLDHVEVKNHPSMVMKLYGIKNSVVCNNTIVNSSRDGIDIWYDSQNVLVEGNHVEGVGDDAYAFSGENGGKGFAVTNLIVRNNFASQKPHSIFGTGFRASGAKSVLFSGNTVIGTFAAGIFVSGGFASKAVKVQPGEGDGIFVVRQSVKGTIKWTSRKSKKDGFPWMLDICLSRPDQQLYKSQDSRWGAFKLTFQKQTVPPVSVAPISTAPIRANGQIGPIMNLLAGNQGLGLKNHGVSPDVDLKDESSDGSLSHCDTNQYRIGFSDNAITQIKAIFGVDDIGKVLVSLAPEGTWAVEWADHAGVQQRSVFDFAGGTAINSTTRDGPSASCGAGVDNSQMKCQVDWKKTSWAALTPNHPDFTVESASPAKWIVLAGNQIYRAGDAGSANSALGVTTGSESVVLGNGLGNGLEKNSIGCSWATAKAVQMSSDGFYVPSASTASPATAADYMTGVDGMVLTDLAGAINRVSAPFPWHVSDASGNLVAGALSREQHIGLKGDVSPQWDAQLDYLSLPASISAQTSFCPRAPFTEAPKP